MQQMADEGYVDPRVPEEMCPSSKNVIDRRHHDLNGCAEKANETIAACAGDVKTFDRKILALWNDIRVEEKPSNNKTINEARRDLKSLKISQLGSQLTSATANCLIKKTETTDICDGAIFKYKMQPSTADLAAKSELMRNLAVKTYEEAEADKKNYEEDLKRLARGEAPITSVRPTPARRPSKPGNSSEPAEAGR